MAKISPSTVTAVKNVEEKQLADAWPFFFSCTAQLF